MQNQITGRHGDIFKYHKNVAKYHGKYDCKETRRIWPIQLLTVKQNIRIIKPGSHDSKELGR